MSEPKGKYKTDKVSTFVPNAFQTPNGYVDDIMPYLTGEEYKVLSYATRRILGFQKRQDRISISQFTDGTKSRDGKTLDQGTGLSRETVKKCLANLVFFGVMVREGENDTRTNEGTLWGLQWDESEVNWTALYERAEKWQKSNLDRIQKARSVRQAPPSGTGGTPDSGTGDGGDSGIGTQNTDLEIQGNKENKDTFLKVISSLASSVFGNDFMKWQAVRRRLEEDNITITGNTEQKPNPSNPMRITICGLNARPNGGQFSEAEIWESRFYRSFANLGLEITFTEQTK